VPVIVDEGWMVYIGGNRLLVFIWGESVATG
jgi:hypothetical protein